MENRLSANQSPYCAFCNSKSMSEIMNFGEVALAGGFLKPNQFVNEKYYPLHLYFCCDCFAVQVTDKVSAEVLFQDYFYYSSSMRTLREHFTDYATEVASRFLNPKTSTVIEFGCNDGVLLRPLADQKIRTVIGIDPATNVINTINDPRIRVINKYFNEEVVENILFAYGKADMVVANNVYAHIPDIQGATRAIYNVLNDDGVFVFEVHYLGKVINDFQYDMIYHEHLYYYSLLSTMKHFERYQMMVFDIKSVPIHAGSMRFYVCKNGSRHAIASDAVKLLEAEEKTNGYDRYESFQRFSDNIAETRRALMQLLTDLKASGKRIAGYGASGRANTMIQYCGITHEHLDYMIDDAAAKIGSYTPGSHFLIQPSSVLSENDAPDYVLVFAWSFFDEICRRNGKFLSKGGRMILPLPKVAVFPFTV
jgi:methylation protein EvaC